MCNCSRGTEGVSLAKCIDEHCGDDDDAQQDVLDLILKPQRGAALIDDADDQYATKRPQH
jgi:hypothetical protein